MIFTTKYLKGIPLKFHMIDVGEGLMVLVIFPNNMTMLYDCNITQERENYVIEELYKYIPTHAGERKIDIFVNSHRDKDHLCGLKAINENFPIQQIWDSGQAGNGTGSKYYEYYMRLRLKVGCYEPKPSLNPVKCIGNVEVYCLSSSEHILHNSMAGLLFEGLKKQHTNAIVLSVKYGKNSLLLTGDSDWYAWKKYIVPQFERSGLLKSSILVASHHGSRSFFTDEANDDIDFKRNPDTTYLDALKYISPSYTLISCGSYEQYHHPNRQAVSQYSRYTDEKRVYTTFDNGTFFGKLFADGEINLDNEKRS